MREDQLYCTLDETMLLPQLHFTIHIPQCPFTVDTDPLTLHKKIQVLKLELALPSDPYVFEQRYEKQGRQCKVQRDSVTFSCSQCCHA
jgi:hypothetical protein